MIWTRLTPKIPVCSAKQPMGVEATSKRFRVLRLWWISCLLVVVCLLALPFLTPIEFDLGSRTYSLRTEILTPDGPFSDSGTFIRTGWDGPTGEFSRGEILGVKLGRHLLRLDIVEDPIAAARRRLPETLEGLVASLNSKDDWLRLVALQRLGEMGGAALVAVPALVNRVEQGDQQAAGTLAAVCKGSGEEPYRP